MKIDRLKLITEMARQYISTAKLSEKSNLSKATISAVRAGKSCSVQTGEAIAKALHVELDELKEE